MSRYHRPKPGTFRDFRALAGTPEPRKPCPTDAAPAILDTDPPVDDVSDTRLATDKPGTNPVPPEKRRP